MLVLDGRGECHLHLGATKDQVITPLFAQALPHSLGLMYEELTEHLGFHRSSDEYKVMALASYAEADFLNEFRRLVTLDSDGVQWLRSTWTSFACAHGGELGDAHAASQRRFRLASRRSSSASPSGSRSYRRTQPRHGRRRRPQLRRQRSSGRGGTLRRRLGSASSRRCRHGSRRSAPFVSRQSGQRTTPMVTAALGRGWSDDDLARDLTIAASATSESTTSPTRRPQCWLRTASSGGSKDA